MKKVRVIARIDVKNEYVIKGIHLEGLRKVGNPNELALQYYEDGIDEIVFMDAVAAYYDRNSLSEIIESACHDVFVPITVGGGIRTLDDINQALKSGADKVAINTQAIRTPNFIHEASQVFGAQCIVASIEAKKVSPTSWECYIDNGREPTGKDVLAWSKELEKLGAGEIMVTSIDAEGTKKGFDNDLIKAVVDNVAIPVIASGGAGNSKHVENMLVTTKADAVANASIFHYKLVGISELKSQLLDNNLEVRK